MQDSSIMVPPPTCAACKSCDDKCQNINKSIEVLRLYGLEHHVTEVFSGQSLSSFPHPTTKSVKRAARPRKPIVEILRKEHSPYMFRPRSNLPNKHVYNHKNKDEEAVNETVVEEALEERKGEEVAHEGKHEVEDEKNIETMGEEENIHEMDFLEANKNDEENTHELEEVDREREVGEENMNEEREKEEMTRECEKEFPHEEREKEEMMRKGEKEIPHKKREEMMIQEEEKAKEEGKNMKQKDGKEDVKEIHVVGEDYSKSIVLVVEETKEESKKKGMGDMILR